LVGGATALVGDPSGRSEERNLLTPEQVEQNVKGVRGQLERFIDFTGPNGALILNNNEWIGAMRFTDWLRDVGKHFTVSAMLAKDSVKRRLQGEQGISYTEFSYQTMQAYDFLYLFDRFDCRLQVGGSDQWGNITAGIEFIRRQRHKPAYGLTFPLVTTASGEKFGKTADNALWLDAACTSPWEFYQYLVRQDDADVIRFLNLYTSLTKERIDELAQSVQSAPARREAQRALAFDVTRTVHGESVAREMERAADTVYRSEISGLSDRTLEAVFANLPSTKISWGELDAEIELVELLVRSNLVSSKAEGRRLIKSGGAYVNNVQVSEEIRLGRAHLASESFIVLRSGKKTYHLVHVT
jgi:tyrosyl-tRNA synthetase